MLMVIFYYLNLYFISFREDIYKKCILCKKEDNNNKHFIMNMR